MRTMEKPASVRTADPIDEPQIFALLIEMHKHNAAGWGWPYSSKIIMDRIETATRRWDKETKRYNPPRTNPQDNRWGVIGVIDGPPGGPLVGAVGVFLDPPMWFSSALTPMELFLFVRKGERGAARHERDLVGYAKWFHAGLKERGAGGILRFPLMTGFVHMGGRFSAMERLWRRLSGGQKVGVMFRWD